MINENAFNKEKKQSNYRLKKIKTLKKWKCQQSKHFFCWKKISLIMIHTGTTTDTNVHQTTQIQPWRKYTYKSGRSNRVTWRITSNEGRINGKRRAGNGFEEEKLYTNQFIKLKEIKALLIWFPDDHRNKKAKNF